MVKTMTTEEYAKTIKHCSQQAIRKAIKKNKLHLLPNVIKITKSGKYHLLEVSVEN